MIRPRVVFDCNALLQALISEGGPAAAALRLAEQNVFSLQFSRPILKELRAVLHYPTVRQSNPDLTDQEVDAFLELLLFRGTLVRRVRHVFDYPRARQDEPYIDLAVACKADYLVTRDNDLLSLMTGHSQLCKRFRQTTHPLRVMNPVEFVRSMEAKRKPR